MDEDNVVITYETIFELVRREKDREALQKLEKTFFHDVLDYLKERKKILVDQESTLIDPEEKRKNEKQFENTKRLIIEFYNKREKKIINLAIDKSRTGADLDAGSLLEEEKGFFQKLVRLLDENRSDILYRLLNLEVLKSEKKEKIEKKEQDNEINVKKEEKGRLEKSTIMVRFVHAVPKFIGKELEEYGPFEEEEIANLPKDIAEVLINKGRAEEIEES